MFIGRLFCNRTLEMQNVHWKNISQQSSRNAEFSSAEYFVVESQKCRMFIGRIFRSGKFQKTKCRSFGRLFTVEFAKFLKCRMLTCRIFRSRKFQKPKCRYLNKLFTAEYSIAEFCIEF